MITCVLSDIPSQISNVAWSTTTNAANLGLNPGDGVIQGTTQSSTLSLSSAQLVKLKVAGGSNPAHVFTCKIMVGVAKKEVTATQTINIYTPSKLFLFKSLQQPRCEHFQSVISKIVRQDIFFEKNCFR